MATQPISSILPISPVTSSTYFMPSRFLNGRGAAMHFWHAVYYLLATRPEIGSQRRCVVTDSLELAEHSGLAKRQIDNERPKSWSLPFPYGLMEEETDSGFVLVCEGYTSAVQMRKAGEKVYQIPSGLVANGWLSLIWQTGRSRLCIAIVNQLLRQPAGRRLLDLRHLAKRCQQPTSKSRPGDDKILSALDCLIELGLIKTEEHSGRLWYRLQTHRLNQPALAPAADSGDLLEHPAVCAALAKDELRARRAVRCAITGRFDPDTHFAEIYRDISYLNWDREHETFLMRASKWASKPPSLSRWREFWQHHCRLRHERDVSRTFSVRFFFDLSRFSAGDHTLFFPQVNAQRLMYARMLVTADAPDYLWNAGPLCDLTVSVEDKRPVWRKKLRGDVRQHKGDLTAECKAGVEAVVCYLTAQQTFPDTLVSTQIETASYKK